LKFFWKASGFKSEDPKSFEYVADFQKKLETDELVMTRVAFTSTRKRASIVIRQPQFEGTDKEVRVYTKGGPDFLMPDVTHFLDENLVAQELEEEAATMDLEPLQNYPAVFAEDDVGIEDYKVLVDRTVRCFAD
jgi:magnesium-transporting ATPase (P-type)